MTLGDHSWPVGPVDRERDEGVGRFPVGVVSLADTYHPVTGKHEVRVAVAGGDLRLGCDRRSLSAGNAVDTLVGEVAGDENAVGYGIRTAAVLVDAGSGVERRGDDISNNTTTVAAHDRLPTALDRPGLDPIQIRPVNGHLT